MRHGEVGKGGGVARNRLYLLKKTLHQSQSRFIIKTTHLQSLHQAAAAVPAAAARCRRDRSDDAKRHEFFISELS
jgi:hypothetical protein